MSVAESARLGEVGATVTRSDDRSGWRSAGTTRALRPRNAALLAFLGYLLVALGWAATQPYSTVTDEGYHVVRAYAVLSGQTFNKPVDASHGTGAYETVPKSLLPADGRCVGPRQVLPINPACATQLSGDREPETV